ncbi:unnamed protein product [Dovyalis caffra]|uniref:Uncharacterized protein n=1 Tax=Dovyalis caffra TaxID=77055 RepID=A0AAV1R241_9ROSI|nr:unnamed protein product [Dovyalis caffra]
MRLRQQQYDTSKVQVAHLREDYEVSQLQRGKSRRCLQFEEAQQKTTTDDTYSSNPAMKLIGSVSPASSAEWEILDSSQMELSISYDQKQKKNISNTDGDGC